MVVSKIIDFDNFIKEGDGRSLTIVKIKLKMERI